MKLQVVWERGRSRRVGDSRGSFVTGEKRTTVMVVVVGRFLMHGGAMISVEVLYKCGRERLVKELEGSSKSGRRMLDERSLVWPRKMKSKRTRRGKRR